MTRQITMLGNYLSVYIGRYIYIYTHAHFVFLRRLLRDQADRGRFTLAASLSVCMYACMHVWMCVCMSYVPQDHYLRPTYTHAEYLKTIA